MNRLRLQHLGWASPGAGLDDGQHIQLRYGLPRQKNSLGVGAGIGRNEEQPLALKQAEIVLRQALDQIVIFQPHPHPETLAPGTGDKGLAQQTFRLVDIAGLEFADKANPFHFSHIDRDQLAAQVEDLGLFLGHKRRRRKVTR